MKTLLFSRQGRISRSQFWLALLILGGVSVVCVLAFWGLIRLMPGSVDENGTFRVEGVAALPYLVIVFGYLVFCVWAGLCVNAKRCHDRGRSAWFMLVQLIPLAGIWYIVETGFLRGTVGPNRFGPDPLDPLARPAPLAVAA